MKRIIGSKKGQNTLEVALVFIMIVLLLGGIMKIWLWSNDQIVRRQIKYNETRVGAGTATDSYQLNWPVYAPRSLSEEEVLVGK